jgi:hypothetical protein
MKYKGNAVRGKKDFQIVHGAARHPLYNKWRFMIRRCRHPDWPHYSRRGIRVCDDWQNPHAFFAWAEASGGRPDLELHRTDGSGNYEPSNCEWLVPRKHRDFHSRRSQHRYFAVVNAVLGFGS